MKSTEINSKNIFHTVTLHQQKMDIIIWKDCTKSLWCCFASCVALAVTNATFLFFWKSGNTSSETQTSELSLAWVEWLSTLPFSSKSQYKSEKWEKSWKRVLKESSSPEGESIEDKSKKENEYRCKLKSKMALNSTQKAAINCVFESDGLDGYSLPRASKGIKLFPKLLPQQSYDCRNFCLGRHLATQTSSHISNF